MNDVTTDTFFNGRIRVDQSASGYRFSLDAVILANTACRRAADRVCDIGTGCGIIPLVMAYRNPGISAVYGIELQRALAETASQNVAQNRLADRVKIICADAKAITTGDTQGPVDLVVCNPPHYEANAGRINPDSQKALARHEISLNLKDLLAAARRILVFQGRLMVIYPAARIAELMARMQEMQVTPKWLRFVHTMPGKAAGRVIVEGVSGGGSGSEIAPPLYVNDEKGRYTPEVEAMFSG